MTVVLIKKEFGYREKRASREDVGKGYREEMAINKPRRETWNIFSYSFQKEPTCEGVSHFFPVYNYSLSNSI